MKKELKKLWAITISLALLLTTIGPMEIKATEIWASGTCGDNITWTIDSDGLLKIEGSGEMYDYKFCKAPWYNNYANQIQKVEISEGITKIGNYAFYYCNCMQEVNFPNTLKKIGEWSFANTEHLYDIELPDSVEEIGNYAFYLTKLREITLPEKIDYIPKGCFWACMKLKKVTVTAENLEYIDEKAFDGASELVSVDVKGEIKEIRKNAFSDCERLQLQNNIIKIDEEAFEGAFGQIDNIDWSFLDHTESIGTNAFNSEYVTKAILPENVVEFGDWPFGEECLEVTVESSKNITVYEDYFVKEGETETSKIYVHKVKTSQPVVVTNESSRAIYVDGVLVESGMSVTSTAIEEPTTSAPEETTEEETTEADSDATKWEYDEDTATLTIYGSAIWNFPEEEIVNKVRHLVFAEGVTSIYAKALYTNVEDVYISSTVVNVYNMSFLSNSRKLKEINVSEENHYYKSIDGNLYSGKNNLRLELDRYAPGKTEEEFVLPTGVYSIEEDAFDWARSLKKVTLTKNVSSVTLPINSYINRVDIMNPDCDIIKSGSKSNLVVSAYKYSQVEEDCISEGIKFEVLEVGQHVTDISVISGPAKKVFKKGTKAILGDIKIRATYEDGTMQSMYTGYAITSVDTSTSGTKTVTITFGDNETTFNVKVEDITEEEYVQINEPKVVPLSTADKVKEIFFVAPVDGIYTIYTTGKYDTYGNLYSMNYSLMAYNDDGGEDNNFSMNKQLTAGQTYIIKVTFYSTTTYTSDYALPELNVTLKRLTGTCEHVYEQSKVVAPTCTSQGYTEYKCKICNDIKKDGYVEKSEHDFEVIKTIEPTCIKDGYLLYRCKNCGFRTGVADKDNPALGHQYIDNVINPTNTEYGYTIHECEICENTYKSDWTDPLGFDVKPNENETTESQTVEDISEKQTMEEQTTTATVSKLKVSKPKVKAKRVKAKIRLTLSSKTKSVKYQIYIKKNGKYKLLKTTTKKTYSFKHKKKCYIKVRCVASNGKLKVYSKFKKLKVK